MFTRISKSNSRILGLLLCIGALATAAATASSSGTHPAGHSCEMQYDVASVAIATGIAGNGDRQTLRTNLDNAWRAFWKDRKLDIANGQLDTLRHLLESNATHGVSAESKQVVRELVGEFLQCINGQTPVGTATLTVSVFAFDETTSDGKGAAAGAGVYLFVDGQHLASTDDDGKAVVTVPAGSVNVQAIVPSSALAEATVQANAGTTVSLELILDDSKEVTSPVQLSVSSLSDSVLPDDFGSFTITLLEGVTPRPAVTVAEVAVEDDIGNTLVHLTDEFEVDAQGRLRPIALSTVADAVRAHAGRSLVLLVSGVDALGFTLVGTVPFHLGQHELRAPARLPDAHR